MKTGKEVFVAPNATLIGRVNLGDESSVWFGAILRADNDDITIGARSNIQDGCILHVDPGVPVVIGEDVVVGHGAIVHGATVGDNTLIGMRATLLNHVKVGKCCIIGAHSLLTEGTEIPDYSVVMGIPGKVVKQLTPEQAEKIKKNAVNYVSLGKRYLKKEFGVE